MTTTASITINSRDLPQLMGSEKQIAWAENLRRVDITAVNEPLPYFDAPDPFVARLLNRLYIETPEDEAVARTAIAAAVVEHFAHAEARYWIDNRDAAVELVIYNLAHPSVIRERNRRSVEKLSDLAAAGTITDGQRARLARLVARRSEWDQ